MRQEKKLCLITHLPLQPTGGGVYAVSWNVSRQLQKHFHLQLPPPIQTPIDRPAQLKSRIRRRLLRRPGEFFSFSDRVLTAMAKKVDSAIPADAEAIFFRTATRWCFCRPDRPYFVHTDACFHTFFHNTFTPHDFFSEDLQRIYDAEARFLRNAAAVFFESAWGLEKTCSAYGLAGDNFYRSRIAGGMEPPGCDRRIDDGTFHIVTVAKHFRQKGGDIVAEAWRMLKPEYPQLRWTIVGDVPDRAIQRLQDVTCTGFLRMSNSGERQQLEQIFATADLLVHPTREDTNPLVLVEAAYFGCPGISVDAFAIPELVEHGVTGILVPPRPAADQIADQIKSLIMDPQRRQRLRIAARERAVRLFDWDAIGVQIADTVCQQLSHADKSLQEKAIT